MKKKQHRGCLEYAFDSNCPDWDSDRAEDLSCALIREFRDEPEVRFRFFGQRLISITIPFTGQEAIVRRAEVVYGRVMTTR